MSKGSDVEPSKTTVPFIVLMEGSDDAEESWSTSNLGKDLEESIPTNKIKGFGDVYKGDEQRLSLFPAFLL